MPTRKSRLTKTEYQEYRARLLRLEKMGIPIGCADDPSPEPDRLILEQIHHDLARIYDLPSGEVEVVVPAKMTVLISGLLITHVEMMVPGDDFPLELSDPEESFYYQDLIARLPDSPTVLNHWLTSEVPLRPRQVEGVIFANGWTSFPTEWHDETLVKVELLFWDERCNEICVEFGVRVDRSLRRKYERLQRERRRAAPLTRRPGLYAPEGGTLGDEKSVSPEEAIKPRHSSGDDDAELQKPN
jgi:hypothetical protein